MGDSLTSTVPTRAKIARWTARVLSALILIFWGIFIVAHLLGDEAGGARPLNARDYVGLITMGTWLVGLAVAWEWEFLGGLITLVAYGVAIAANPAVLVFVFVPITAVLFLVSWWIRRGPGDRIASGGPSA